MVLWWWLRNWTGMKEREKKRLLGLMTKPLGLCFSAGAPRFPLCFTVLCVCSALMPKDGACSGEETTGAGVPGSTQSPADLGGLLFCLHSQMSLSLGFNLNFFWAHYWGWGFAVAPSPAIYFSSLHTLHCHPEKIRESHPENCASQVKPFVYSSK